MFENVRQAQDYCKNQGIRMIDFKMVDINGRWRHLTIPAERLDEGTMRYGIGFDGSNYGYAPRMSARKKKNSARQRVTIRKDCYPIQLLNPHARSLLH